MTVQIETTADLLAGTREYIEEHGWIQDEMFDVDGPGTAACMVGGMLSAMQLEQPAALHVYSPVILQACSALSQYLGRATHTTEECVKKGYCTCVVSWVTTWNDEEGRTKQEVLDALAKVEKIERAGFDPDAA